MTLREIHVYRRHQREDIGTELEGQTAAWRGMK